jgi:organic radical activating enzyme
MKEITSFYNTNTISDHDFLIFEVLIIELCNMNCSYCYMRNESHTWGQHYSKKNIDKALDALFEIHKEKPVSICLSGGEATIHPSLLYFMERIHDKGIDLHLNTNLQLSIEKLEKVLKFSPTFHISVHSETLDDEDFVTKLKMIEGDKREINVMLHPNKKYHDAFHNIIGILIDTDIKFYLKTVYINSKLKISDGNLKFLEQYKDITSKEYVDQDNERYNDYDLLANKMLPMDTFGWKCNYIFFTINGGSGDIKQMCRLFNITNIFEDIKFFKEYDLENPIICPLKDSCLWASSLDHYKVKA